MLELNKTYCGTCEEAGRFLFNFKREGIKLLPHIDDLRSTFKALKKSRKLQLQECPQGPKIDFGHKVQRGKFDSQQKKTFLLDTFERPQFLWQEIVVDLFVIWTFSKKGSSFYSLNVPLVHFFHCAQRASSLLFYPWKFSWQNPLTFCLRQKRNLLGEKEKGSQSLLKSFKLL